MNCTKCGSEVSDNDNFCGNCGISLSSTNSTEGDGSVNIAGSNTISNSHLHVGDVYQTESQEKRAYIDRTYVKPVTLAGSPVKTSWLITSGLVGFVGSWASIFSMFGSSWQFLFLVVLGLSIFLFMNGIILWRTRFSRLKWFNLESNKDGEVFLTKVAGSCPKCDGTLQLVDLKVSQHSSKTFVRCSRNGDHIWSFDPTVLD
ncbi:zinc ribbon domain-containing protein [Halomonas sp. DN3]|uniref:zinc ribbon domain-containing protein n=1 Tax=Halomonas sp. DN3 TaxID=2953657 RepID=UPI00209CF22A|nr:zinc ribbon domain-containing protein [Halomonas sp. DN3]USZ51282.1 zinc ribbon domain-containing protein [Halomonas sp. DN3]